MTTLPDLLYVALFAFIGPLIDYSVLWPAHRRLSQADPVFARRWIWMSAISSQWMLIGFGAAIWLASGRSWDSFGFTTPVGWRLWTAIVAILLLAAYHGSAIVSLTRNADARASLQQQVAPLAAVLPHTRTELYWFGGVSLTAGFCEEFLYRGYFIWALSPWLGWWGAAVLSLVLFATGHAYQGWSGVVRTGVVGALFTVIVAALGSLWPAIVLHTLLDFGMGMIAWLALRDGQSATGDVAVAMRADARSASSV